jgi:uncharacterized protein (TIGR02757 family)
MDSGLLKKLDNIYIKYNKKELVHPDPLEFLYDYEDVKDVEIAGLIASSVAFGRVWQIIKAASFILNDIMKTSPYTFLKESSYDDLTKSCEKFSYRFVKNFHLASLLINIKDIIENFGSLNECFLKGFSEKDENILPAMTFFVSNLYNKKSPGPLIARPEKKSACKRINLFLRWMIRKDDVDPGGWHEISSSKLIIPLDTHMHNISYKLGLTKRKQANMQAAIEITEKFKKILPEDPVKYDFALTRFGIRDDMNIENLFKKFL